MFIVVMHLALQALAQQAQLVHRHATETKETNISNEHNIVKNANW